MIRSVIGMSLAALCLMASPAFADGKIYVQLPDLSSYHGEGAQDFLRRVVLANVISSNCEHYGVTGEEWSLLTDAADIIAKGTLGLDSGSYDDQYYDPAFAVLDDAGACETYGPDVQPTLDRLVELGGSREALPDQDAAYQADLARQAAWDAAATGDAPKSKKTK